MLVKDNYFINYLIKSQFIQLLYECEIQIQPILFNNDLFTNLYSKVERVYSENTHAKY